MQDMVSSILMEGVPIDRVYRDRDEKELRLRCMRKRFKQATPSENGSAFVDALSFMMYIVWGTPRKQACKASGQIKLPTKTEAKELTKQARHHVFIACAEDVASEWTCHHGKQVQNKCPVHLDLSSVTHCLCVCCGVGICGYVLIASVAPLTQQYPNK